VPAEPAADALKGSARPVTTGLRSRTHRSARIGFSVRSLLGHQMIMA